jgi:hypothetical protein
MAASRGAWEAELWAAAGCGRGRIGLADVVLVSIPGAATLGHVAMAIAGALGRGDQPPGPSCSVDSRADAQRAECGVVMLPPDEVRSTTSLWIERYAGSRRSARASGR